LNVHFFSQNNAPKKRATEPAPQDIPYPD
jgi:hypothetical protein